MVVSSLSVNAKPPRTKWTIGKQIEFTPGVFATLYLDAAGWRVWRIETRDRVSCTIDKGITGGPLLLSEPLSNTAPYFIAGSPRLEGSINTDGIISWKLKGSFSMTDPGGTTEYRHKRDKFFTEVDKNHPVPIADGDVIEVHVVTSLYPILGLEIADEHGFISLSGLNNGTVALRSCELTVPKK